jgi:hypothetical protein
MPAGSFVVDIKAAGLTPNGRALIALARPGAQPFSTRARVDAAGHVVTLLLPLCPSAGETVTVQDLTSGQRSQPRRITSCNQGIAPTSSPPWVCDANATTPNICATVFAYGAEPYGYDVVFGTGFRAGEHLHVAPVASSSSFPTFDVVAGEMGLVNARSPQQVHCATSALGFTVSDAAAHVSVRGLFPQQCREIGISVGTPGMTGPSVGFVIHIPAPYGILVLVAILAAAAGVVVVGSRRTRARQSPHVSNVVDALHPVGSPSADNPSHTRPLSW